MAILNCSTTQQATSRNAIKIGDTVRINDPDSPLHQHLAKVTDYTEAGKTLGPTGSILEWPESYALAIFDDERRLLSQWLQVSRSDFVEVHNG